MTLDRIKHVLSDARPELAERFGVRSLSVFGSVARGDDRLDSDIDILAEFEPEAQVTLFTLAGLRLRLTDLLGRDVDLGTRGGLRPRARQTILQEAVRVA